MNGKTSININGQPVTLTFGFMAIKEFSIAAAKKRDLYYETTQDAKGKEQSNLTFFGYAKLFHSAYKNDCELKETEPEFTLEEFNEWVEGSMGDQKRTEEIAKALVVFAESKYVKTLIDQVDVETKKKTPKKSLKK